MFQVLKGLFGGRPAAKAAARRARPGVESLEDRLVLSAAIAPLPAVNSSVFSRVGTAAADAFISRTVARSDAGTVVRVTENFNGLRYSLFNPSGGLRATGQVPNTDPTRDSQLTVAMGNNGRFVVAWTHVYSTDDLDVRAQVFDANGNAVGGTIWVAASYNVEDEPAAGMDQAGNFVVAYRYGYYGTSHHEIYASTYNASGGLLSITGVANSAVDEGELSVAMNRYGQFVLAFNSYSPSYAAWTHGLSEITYSLYGQPLGSAWVWVGGIPSNDDDNPSAAIDMYGDVGIAYTYGSPSGPQVGVRRFNVFGQYLGFTHAGWGGEAQYLPSISMADDGRFVVAYMDDWGGQTSIYAEEYSASGTQLSWTDVGSGGNYMYMQGLTVATDASGDFAVDYLVSPYQGGGNDYQTGTLYHF